MKQLRALYKRVGYTAASFVLALSTLTAAVPFILSENVGAVGGQSLYVSKDGADNTDCSDESQPCLTIQYAVGEAGEGDTINVAAGEYVESLHITGTVDVVGAGQGQTTIKAPATSFVNGSDLVAISGAGVNVELRDLSIGGQSSSYATEGAGVHIYDGANASIDMVSVSNTYTSIDKNAVFGILVGARNFNGLSTGTATISDSSVTDYGRGGIHISGAGSYATVVGSTVKGGLVGATGLQNGIVVEFGANANVQGNNVQGNWYAGSNWSGSGIAIWDSANEATVVKGNIVTDNQVGISLVTDSPAVLANVDVSGSTGNNSDARVDSPSYSSWGYWPWSTAPDVAYVDAGNTLSTYSISMVDGKALVKGYSLFSDVQEAVDAVAVGGTVKIMKDVNVSSPVVITKDLTFDGNGYSVLSAFGPTSTHSGVINVHGVSGDDSVRFVANNNKLFRVHGQGGATIQGPGNHNGLHGINVYDSNVELNNVILSNNGKAGLNVGRNSSAVVTGIRTLNNGWYGINVDKTTSGTFSNLTVKGTSVHEEGDNPHIFTDVRANVTPGVVEVNYESGQYDRIWQDGGYAYMLDTERPEISLDADEFNPETFSVTASDDQQLKTIGYSIWKNGEKIGVWGETVQWNDRHQFDSIKSTYKLTATGEYLDLADLGEGSYTIHATATDTTAKTKNAKGVDFMVDRSAPVVEISDVAVSADKELSFNLRATDTGGSGVEIVSANIYNAENTGSALIKLGEGNPSRLNVPYEGLPSGENNFETTVSGVDVSELATGTYTIRAFARDHSGNEHRFLLVRFTVDNTSPDMPVISAVNANGAAGTAEAGSTVEVTVAGVTYTTLADADGNWSIAFATPLTPDSYLVQVTATDEAGNTSGVATRNLAVLAPALAPETTEQAVNEEDDEDDAPIQTAALMFPAGFVANPDLTPEVESDDNGEAALGATTENAAQAAGAAEDASLLGLAWYWWVVIGAAILAGLWWLITAIRGRSGAAEA